MKIIKPYLVVIDFDLDTILQNIEIAGRTCYKSEDKITPDSAKAFVQMLLRRNHTAMLEFGHIIIKVVCDRGVSHEIVRHRLFSFAQESTRYCNYSSDKFDSELTFIKPCFWEDKDSCTNYLNWKCAIKNSEDTYLNLIKNGATPQEARSVLPNSLKTEIVIGGNLREWLHFLKLRTDKAAHPQMIEVAKLIEQEFKQRLPELFKQSKETRDD